MKLDHIIGVLLSVTIIEICPAAIAQEIFPTAIVPGGTVTKLQGSNLYGNNATLRNAYLPSGAQKSYVDFESVLPAGIVVKYYIYIHNFTTEGETTKIRLQIWRPTLLENNYILVWERQVSVSLTHAGGALYEFDLGHDDQFLTQQGDRIGWTNEGNSGAISFRYVEGHRTFFRKVDNGDFPQVGVTTYLFDNIHLPSIFSAAVEINTGRPLTTIMTSQPGRAPPTTAPSGTDNPPQTEGDVLTEGDAGQTPGRPLTTIMTSQPGRAPPTTAPSGTDNPPQTEGDVLTEGDAGQTPGRPLTTIMTSQPGRAPPTTAPSGTDNPPQTEGDVLTEGDAGQTPDVAAVYRMLWVIVGVCGVLMVTVIVIFTICRIKVRRLQKALQAAKVNEPVVRPPDLQLAAWSGENDGSYNNQRAAQLESHGQDPYERIGDGPSSVAMATSPVITPPTELPSSSRDSGGSYGTIRTSQIESRDPESYERRFEGAYDDTVAMVTVPVITPPAELPSSSREDEGSYNNLRASQIESRDPEPYERLGDGAHYDLVGDPETGMEGNGGRHIYLHVE